MSTTRPPQPGPNYYWSDLFKTWVPNSDQILKDITKGATSGGLTSVLAPIATGGTAKEAAQTAAAETLAQKLINNKVAIAVVGVGILAAVYFYARSRKA
jgi:hypothetical protein